MALADALDELRADAALCGYSVAVTVVFELPIFQFGDWLIRHWGHDLMIWLAVLSYLLRVLGYTQLTPATVWYILALEPFHGITFALAWTAAVDKMKIECPDRWQTTGQLLLNTMMWSVGRTAGSLFGGYWYEHGTLFGHRHGRALYWAAFLGAAGLLALHSFLTALLRAGGMRGLHTVAPPAPLSFVDPLLGAAAEATEGRSEDPGTPQQDQVQQPTEDARAAPNAINATEGASACEGSGAHGARRGIN